MAQKILNKFDKNKGSIFLQLGLYNSEVSISKTLTLLAKIISI